MEEVLITIALSVVIFVFGGIVYFFKKPNREEKINIESFLTHHGFEVFKSVCVADVNSPKEKHWTQAVLLLNRHLISVVDFEDVKRLRQGDFLLDESGRYAPRCARSFTSPLEDIVEATCDENDRGRFLGRVESIRLVCRDGRVKYLYLDSDIDSGATRKDCESFVRLLKNASRLGAGESGGSLPGLREDLFDDSITFAFTK